MHVMSRRSQRKGATAVEFAFVAPVLFLLIFGLIEMGRTCMTLHSLQEAAREGCRRAILANTMTAEVELRVQEVLASTGITTYNVTVDPDPPSTAAQWEAVTVTVDALYNDVNWLPVPMYLGGMRLSGSSTLPREADEGSL